MASLYTPKDPESKRAQLFGPGSRGGSINVINEYAWTLTPPSKRKEIPSIELTEYQVDESTIARQLNFYATQVFEKGLSEGEDFLGPYDQLFPKDQPTDFKYIFPFYADINFEVNTPQWSSLDTLESFKKGAEDLGSFVHPVLGKAIKTVTEIGAGVAGGLLAANYPKVGIMDRPKLWQSHDFRSYTVKFPLYNTQNTDKGEEWIKNRELCELIVNQNLYTKTSFITGKPPVFYEVLIPGQHYSPASCVTNISILNKGNIRQLLRNGVECNVPDVYEINITLTDLVIPSKNLFQAISNQTVRTRYKDTNAGATPLETAQEFVGNTVNSVIEAANNTLETGAEAFRSVAASLTPSNPPGVTPSPPQLVPQQPLD